MKKMITGVVVIMLGLIAMLATPRAFAQADSSTIHIHRTLNDIRPNPCNGEPVQLQADLDLTIHRTTDGAGGFHMHITSNLHGSGLGLVTGAKYVLNAVATSAFNTTGATNETLWQDAVIIGQGNVPNFLFQQTEHFTIDANGNVTTVFNQEFTKCLG